MKKSHKELKSQLAYQSNQQPNKSSALFGLNEQLVEDSIDVENFSDDHNNDSTNTSDVDIMDIDYDNDDSIGGGCYNDDNDEDYGHRKSRARSSYKNKRSPKKPKKTKKKPKFK
jgi:hypothetical protein